MISAADLSIYETCTRRYSWSKTFVPFRVSPIAALYEALHAGLTGNGEADAKNALMKVAGMPGLDVEGASVYDVAVHLSFLAGIVVAYLRGKDGPWQVVKATPEWESACYESPDGRIRRVVLVDRWTEDRKLEEARSWRTVGEICATGREMLLNAITIGSTSKNRRVGHWSRALTHPRNRGIRFKRKTASPSEFAGSWLPVWRENSSVTTEDWLAGMQRDECYEDVVHSLRIGVPARRQEFLEDMARMAKEMAVLPETPPMRRQGCWGFSPCVFAETCHAKEWKSPAEHGWLRYSDLG
jgi:hypothetical protein